MRRLFTWIAVLFTLFIIPCCSDEEVKKDTEYIFYPLPPGSEFYYNTGDVLNYSCSDGTTEQLKVLEYNRWTEISTSSGWFGTEVTVKIEYQEVIFQSLTNTWLDELSSILTSPGLETPCFTIKTGSPVENGYPNCLIFGSSCSSDSTAGDNLLIAMSNDVAASVTFGTETYSNVYVDAMGGEQRNYTVHWTLNEGVIRFETTKDGATKSWIFMGEN